MVHLTITLDGVRRFIGDPEREGTAEGWVEWAPWPGRMPVESGTFNLFTDDGRPDASRPCATASSFATRRASR